MTKQKETPAPYKLTWLSNAPWSPTGYGNQTKLFLPRIKALGYDPAIIAFWGLEGGPLGGWNGIQVYPKGFHDYGQDIMSAHTKFYGAEMMFSLMDAWVVDTDMVQEGINWVPWFPIDSDPLPPPVFQRVKDAFARIVFSKHGMEKMDEAGLDYHYVPHGVDTKALSPVDMAEARERLGWPQDKFVLGMVAANKGNPPRKCFPQILEAFRQLKEKHDDVMLYLHTHEQGHMGVDLPNLCKLFDLKVGEDVIFAGQYHLMLGFPDSYMQAIYSAMDAHVLVSMGEGFGIPIVEAQACGCPVITGDWTSMSELTFSGWKVPKEEAQPFFTPLYAYQYLPNVGAITDAMLQAYRMKGNQDYRDAARKGALQYDADKVTEKYWKPVLKQLFEDLEESKRPRNWSTTGGYFDGKFCVPSLEPGDPASLEIKNDIKRVKLTGFEEEVNGVKLDIEDDPQGGVYKLVMREIRENYDFDSIPFEAGDVVVDIGAHVGVVSCYLAKKYPEIDVHAIEPDMVNFEHLVRNVHINNLKIQCLNMAITADGRNVQMSGRGDLNSGSKNIYGTYLNDSEVVASLTLKEYISNKAIYKIKLLKIDCEGAEYEIIEANPEVLRKVEYIRGEIHPMPGKNPQDLIELIAKYIKPENINLTVLNAGGKL